LKAKFETKTLKSLTDFLMEATNEINLIVKKDEIYAEIYGISGISAGLVRIPTEKIKDFKFEGEEKIGIDTKQFKDNLEIFRDNEIEITTKENRIYLKSQFQETYFDMIDTKESDEAFPKAIKMMLPVSIELDYTEFRNLIASIEKMYSIFDLKFENKKLFIIGKRYTSGITRELEIKTIFTEEKAKASYQAELVKSLLAGNTDKTVKLQFGKDLPLRIIFKIGEADIISIIAPRTEKED